MSGDDGLDERNAEIHNLEERRRARAKQPPKDGNARAEICIEAGQRGKVVDLVDDMLEAMGHDSPVFRQTLRLVRIVQGKVKFYNSEEGNTTHLVTVDGPTLGEIFERSAKFLKWSKTEEDYVACNCPDMIIDTFLARGTWKVPFLRGVALAPLVRYDGSILETPGYDEKTALYYYPGTCEFPSVPHEPTLDDARAALAYLKRPLRAIPFADGPAASVALSGILTALNRKSLPTAPMHAFTSPVAGSGKSLLVDAVSMMCTGTRTAVITNSSGAHSEQALESNLQSSMLRGDAILSIDNQSTALSSDMLCALLTQLDFSIRLFHTQNVVVVPLSTTFFCTGNNLTIKGDLTRRALLARIDAHMDRPELRHFDFDMLNEIAQDRGPLVAAALTLLRYRYVCGEPQQAGALGSYERWSWLVRDTLVLLGESDPLVVVDEIRGQDPILLRLAAIMSAWADVLGESNAVKCADVISKACERRAEDWGTDTENEAIWLHGDLREALSMLAPGGRVDRLTPTVLGYWLRSVRGRPVGGRCFMGQEDAHSKMVKWSVEKTSSPTA